MFIYRLSQAEDDIAHASGATIGDERMKALKQKLQKEIPEEGRGQIILLDFAGVQSASASFLKATALWLFNCGQMNARGERPEFVSADDPSVPRPYEVFPAMINTTSELDEELDEVFARRDAPCANSARSNG